MAVLGRVGGSGRQPLDSAHLKQIWISPYVLVAAENSEFSGGIPYLVGQSQMRGVFETRQPVTYSLSGFRLRAK